MTLLLRLNFQNVTDQVLLGAVGVKYQRLGECSLNLKDFGAIGDGVANDTAAVQASFAAVPAEGLMSVFRQGPTSSGRRYP